MDQEWVPASIHAARRSVIRSCLRVVSSQFCLFVYFFVWVPLNRDIYSVALTLTTCISIRSETWHAFLQELGKMWPVNITELHFRPHPHLAVGRFQFYVELTHTEAKRGEIVCVRLPTPSEANVRQGYLSLSKWQHVKQGPIYERLELVCSKKRRFLVPREDGAGVFQVEVGVPSKKYAICPGERVTGSWNQTIYSIPVPS